METLSFTYDPWLILPCFLLGVGFAVLLYFRDRNFADQPTWLRVGLASFRFIVISFLAILLLKPFFKQTTEEVQKPVIAILADNSQSVRLTTDTTLLASVYQSIDQLSAEWASNADIDLITFGSETGIDKDSPEFNDQSTDIASALDYIDDTYAGVNLGAVVILSDGIFNTGRHPLYIDHKSRAPIYTVALGDTSLRKDLSLQNTFANRIAYLGDKVEIQVDITANNLEGERSTLRIIELDNDGLPAADPEIIDIQNDRYFQTFSFLVEPDEAGVKRYRIIASALPGEWERSNNFRDVYIEVLDSRQKVLILSDAPHPDLAAISSLLDLKKTKEVESKSVKEFKGNLNPYDLVIFHQVPGNDPRGYSALEEWKKTDVPALFILGSQSNISRFNSTQDLINIEGNNGQLNEVLGYVENSFTLFTLDQQVKDLLPLFPPIYSPFGEYSIKTGAQVLLSQKIGDIESGFPLLLFGESNGKKTGVLAAEGIWRWKLFNYLEKENFEAVNGLIEKSVQYLAIRSDKRRFRLEPKKNVYNSNDVVEFNAELYNSAYERISTPDVELRITDDEGNVYEYIFDKRGDSYTLDAGRFKQGNYRYTATTNLDGQDERISGSFSVQPVQLESFKTTADHNLLNLLSKKYNGKMFYPQQMDQLGNAISESNALKPIYYSTTQNAPAIDLKSLLYLLLGLLAVEWFVRKYLGSY